LYRDIIYLDNAATSFPKPEPVCREMDRCMRTYCANPGRSGHAKSLEAGRKVMEAREELCSFFGIEDAFRLVFTKNATEALNIAIKGMAKPGGHVIATCMEHNSVLRPLKALERQMGIRMVIVGGNEYGEVDPDDIKRRIDLRTFLIVCTLSSNVNGVIMPVEEIGKIARKYGVKFLVDASQGAGTLPLDVRKLNADAMAFPGHKGLMGPQGTGGLYLAKGVYLETILEGGTGSFSESLCQPRQMPDRIESGTLNTPGIAGLSAGVKFIKSKGLENITKHKNMLTQRLHEGIKEIKGLKLYSIGDSKRNSGIVAFSSDKFDSNELCSILDSRYNIACRGGLHCAPLAHKALGTLKEGLVRLSPGFFNTVEEAEFVLKALREIQAVS
jgi:cysteine desulfurase/selenocysteine lyase